MRIGELAKATGLSRDTIRFYERQGLIESQPGQSETNNYRDYPEHLVDILGFLAAAREAGMTVADLRGLREATNGSCSSAAAIAAMEQHIAAQRESIAASERLIGFLENSIQRLKDADTGC